MSKKLTNKREKYCIEYVKTGSKSEAYRLAYSTKNMKPATVNNKAYALFKKGEVRARIEELQNEAAERNKISIDECVSLLTSMARFDIADCYHEDGTLKSIHEIPKETRLAIEALDVEERNGIELGEGGTVSIATIKKLKTSNRRANLVELLKVLGGYEKDNNQKQQDNIVIFKIPDNGRG
mgnify:CR=1 FL=1